MSANFEMYAESLELTQLNLTKVPEWHPFALDKFCRQVVFVDVTYWDVDAPYDLDGGYIAFSLAGTPGINPAWLACYKLFGSNVFMQSMVKFVPAKQEVCKFNAHGMGWSPSFRYCRMLASNKQSDIYYQIRMWSDLGHAQLVPLLSKVDYVVHCDQDYSI